MVLVGALSCLPEFVIQSGKIFCFFEMLLL